MKKGESTKKKIAEAFKNLVKTDSFDSITITDITNECDLNRLTFYYHFKDKYDLLNWIFYTEVIKPVRENIEAANWAERLLSVLRGMKDNKDYYDKVISYERLDFWNYLFDVAKEIMTDTIRAKNVNGEISESDVLFLAYFFAFGVSGSIFDWAAQGMQKTPEELTQQVVSVVRDCENLALRRYFPGKDIIPQAHIEK